VEKKLYRVEQQGRVPERADDIRQTIAIHK
jgi:hypothetical protein